MPNANLLYHLIQPNRPLNRLGRSLLALLLGLGLCLGLWVVQSPAASTVVLQYRDLRQAVPLADLQAFASGQPGSPSLQAFLQQTEEDQDQVRQWLTARISPPSLDALIAPDFVLIQVNKTIGDPGGRANLPPLRTALRNTMRRQSTFSMLDLLGRYPEGQVRLELSRLERAYNDVELLVTRISPVIKTTAALLPELLCECDRADAGTAIAYQQARQEMKTLLSAAPAAPALALLPADAPELARKRLVLQFGPFSRSVSLSALTRFAVDGEISRGWRSLFSLARVDPNSVRAALTQEIPVNLQTLDSTFNSLLGEFLLYQVGQIVHTSANTANIQALRSAALLSAADDSKLSLLEVLQRYPTRQVYINGIRLANLGGTASRIAEGGVTGAAGGIEDWLVQLQASAAETVCSCPTEPSTTAANLMRAPRITPAKIAQYLPPGWQPVAPHREDRGRIKVVWLQGTPYEMGYQHGQLLHQEIASMGPEVLSALRLAGRGLGLGRLAAKRSFPTIVQECRGLTAATKDLGMTFDACMVLAYGDVYQELFGYTLPNLMFWDGCSQWVATNAATKDGRLYHGSTVDNNQKPVDYIINNPVVFIRQPNDGLPHIFISYPGMLWPNWGVNVAGITLGLDTLHPVGPQELSLEGGSNVQIMGQILKTATSFAEARQIMETQPRVRANLIMITDGKSKEAGVFEFTGKSLGVRLLQPNGVLYMTNHGLLPEMKDKQSPPNSSSLTRFERFSQLMEPGGSQSYYGRIEPAVMAKIGRDRTNPRTLQPSPPTVFDDDASPGGNGSLRQGIYDPDKLLVWVAGGPPPVPENPFVCLSIGQMLNFPNAAPCPTPSL